MVTPLNLKVLSGPGKHVYMLLSLSSLLLLLLRQGFTVELASLELNVGNPHASEIRKVSHHFSYSVSLIYDHSATPRLKILDVFCVFMCPLYALVSVCMCMCKCIYVCSSSVWKTDGVFPQLLTTFISGERASC